MTLTITVTAESGGKTVEAVVTVQVEDAAASGGASD